jgi:hypothetical protein
MRPTPTRGEYNTQTAAGTTQATAAEMNADTVMVTAGSQGAGIIIRPLNVREEVTIVNGTSGTTAIDLYVYPQVGGKINNASANLHLLLPAQKAVRIRAIDGGGNVVAFF